MNPDKLRITHQREVILEELRSVTSHPTADELFAMVRQRLPRISLATVYRNLEWLTDQGMIQKIEVGGRQKRFDGNVRNHHHIRCLGCGKVDDVDDVGLENVDGGLTEINGYKLLGHRLEFRGLCPLCQTASA